MTNFEWKIYPCNLEVLPKTPFIRNKKIFKNFKDKKSYHQWFEANKLKRAEEVKIYLEKSIKCNCGRPAQLMVKDPYDIESLTWVDEPTSVIIGELYSCKNKKCLAKLAEILKEREMDI